VRKSRGRPTLHEFASRHEIYRVCRESMRVHAPARLMRVRVAVGELSAVEPDLLSFAWVAIVGEGPRHGAALEIDWRPGRQYCRRAARTSGQGEGAGCASAWTCGAPLEIDGGPSST